MKTLTFFNHAGGAMKTSLTRDVGHTLATRGLRVLLIDLDPQANLSDWLGVTDVPDERTVYATAVEEAPLPEPYQAHGLHLIPSNVNMALAEGAMMGRPAVHLNLRESLRIWRDRYDVTLIDSPPSLGQLAILGAIAADQLIVPVPTRHKGLQGLEGLSKVFSTYRKLRPDLTVALYVPTLYDSRRRHDREHLEYMRQHLRPLASPVPERGAVWNDSAAAGEPVGVHAAGSSVHGDVLRVTEEIARAAHLPLGHLPPGVADGEA